MVSLPRHTKQISLLCIFCPYIYQKIITFLDPIATQSFSVVAKKGLNICYVIKTFKLRSRLDYLPNYLIKFQCLDKIDSSIIKRFDSVVDYVLSNADDRLSIFDIIENYRERSVQRFLFSQASNSKLSI